MPITIRLVHPFNGALESSLRTLFILGAFQGQDITLEQLAYLDYLLVHSGDIDGGPKSLHPAVPHRGGEWMSRLPYIERGLEVLVSRELARKKFAMDGIKYSATDLGVALLKYFSTEYALQLKQRAIWIYERFARLGERQMRDLLNEKMSEWGSEFKRESLFRSTTFEQ